MEKTKGFSVKKLKASYASMKEDTQFANDRKRWVSNIKKFILGLFKMVIIVGIAYVILGPVIGIIARSFFSDADNYNPMVYLIPQDPTISRYTLVLQRLNYWKVGGASLLYSLSLMEIGRAHV